MIQTARTDKSVRVPYAIWRRAKICSIEADISLIEWVTQALALKADVQEKSGKLSRNGARVASVRAVIPTQGASDGK